MVGISVGLESAPLRSGDQIYLGKGQKSTRKLVVEYGNSAVEGDGGDGELARAIESSLQPSSRAGGDEDLAIALQASLQSPSSSPPPTLDDAEDETLARAINASLQTSSQAGGDEDLATALQ